MIDEGEDLCPCMPPCKTDFITKASNAAPWSLAVQKHGSDAIRLEQEYQTYYHCSPTALSFWCRPRFDTDCLGRFRGENLAGSNGSKDTVLDTPSISNSDNAIPLMGPHKMPQQLCPVPMYAL